MRDPENRATGIRRSRRNLLRMGTIAASAMLAISAKTKPVDAVCATARGCNCFLKGTTIRTSDGDKRIEDLAVGDLLPTVFGGIRPIQWIGRYQFRKNYSTEAWPEDAVPIRVARSSLGPNVPHADLFVTKAHALLIDDVLVPACNLINGTTIALYDARALDELEFFHIKLELHDVIYAEGVPCETLRNVDENAINFPEYLREYGLPISGNTPCVPVLGSGCLDEIKSRFRSAISPWIDRRQKLDIVRDKLEEGEIVPVRQLELTP